MNKKVLIPIICGVVVVALLLFVFLNKKNENNNVIERPDYDYSAVIYHSAIIGPDAGKEYTYTIYKSDESYFYIKSESYVTIEGSVDQKDVGSGSIKNKAELEKVQEMIDEDSKDFNEVYTTYMYVENGIKIQCKDLNELATKLFE